MNIYRPSAKTFKLNSSELLLIKLTHHDIDTIFGYTGGAILPVFNQLKDFGIKFIMNRTEQCNGHSAEGYAKTTGKLGVSLVTSGPGVTNSITPLQDAYSDGVPMLLLSGQVNTNTLGTSAFQECPAIELTKPCTKWNYQVTDSSDLLWCIDNAIDIAMSGRKGPVHIDLCKDIMMTDFNVCESKIYSNKQTTENNKINHSELKKIDKIIKLINIAKKPVLFIGQGAIDCSDLINDLVDKLQIHVTSTLHGLGIFDESNPLSLKMVGMHGSAYSNFAIQEADLIIGIGTRFDDRTVGNIEKYAPKAYEAAKNNIGGVIHNDISEDSFSKTIEATYKVKMDSKDFIENLINKSNNFDYSDRKDWINQINTWKELYPFIYKKSDKIQIPDVLIDINNYLKNIDKYYIATGVGNHQMMAAQFIDWKTPRSIVSSGSLGTMGSGLPYAIGAQVGNPDDLVILIDGDGSFNMTLNDLATIAEYNLPIKIAIMNDSRLQMVYVWQELFFNKNIIGTELQNPDFCKLAESYGIKSMKIDDKNGLSSNINDFLNYPGPILCEFKIEPSMCLPLVSPGKALHEMVLYEKNKYNIDTTNVPC